MTHLRRIIFGISALLILAVALTSFAALLIGPFYLAAIYKNDLYLLLGILPLMLFAYGLGYDSEIKQKRYAIARKKR